MIDKNGFRLNVGIVLANGENHLFWGRRIGNLNSWQFPQGGINPSETVEQAMYRELHEEVGLLPKHVQILGITQLWLTYYIPQHLRSRVYNKKPACIGQKQKWFLLRFIGDDSAITFSHSNKPEFVQWQWVDYWRPIQEIVAFKRGVYKLALEEFAPILFGPAAPSLP